MRRFKRFLCALCLVVTLFAALPLTTAATDANVTYDGNAGDIIFSPGSNHSPTDLFPDFKNVMPGATLTQRIRVCNKADNKVKVKIYLRSFGAEDAQSKAFLDQLQLTVTKASDTPMFEAEADKTAGLSDWVGLGMLYSGGELDLDITLHVPTSLDNRFQKQIGKIHWQFMTVEIPIDEHGWVCPECGSHDYHIVEHEDHVEYLCEKCGHKVTMLCEICKKPMYRVDIRTKDGKVFYYYQCIDEASHHTDPVPPPTGDTAHLTLWIVLTVVLGLVLILLIILLFRKKRNDSDEETGAKK